MHYMNQTTLSNLRQFLSEEKLFLLLTRYIEDTSNIIQQLQVALNSSLQAEAQRLCHSLKSTSANVGALPLSELARQLEALAREGQLDEMKTMVPELGSCFAQTQLTIEDMEFMRQRQTG